MFTPSAYVLAVLLSASATASADVCLGEYCCFGQWRARERVSVWPDTKVGRTPAFTLERDERVTTLRGVVIVRRPGLVELVKPMRVSPTHVIAAGENLQQLYPLGEGYHEVEYGGARHQVFLGIYRPGVYPANEPELRLVVESEYEWWVHLRTASGKEGWAIQNGTFRQECNGSGTAGGLGNFRDQPVLAAGESVRTLVARLGEPQSASFELVENAHDPKMKDVRIALGWDGIGATVQVALCCDKSLLESVHVTSPAGANALGVPWFVHERDVRRSFGPPRKDTGGELVYVLPTEVGADTIIFHTKSGKVASVEWRYFID